MYSTHVSRSLSGLFSEVIDGATTGGGAYVLNSGDPGLLRSLDRLSAEDASHSANGGATIAAHVQHLRYGLSLMNRWAREGGNPFADAAWDAAWKIGAVTDDQWQEIRGGLRDEASSWREMVSTAREATEVELTGLISSVVHLAYHFGAIRQIARGARGPREGTFAAS